MLPSSRDLPTSSDEYLAELASVINESYRKKMPEQFKLQVRGVVATVQSSKTEVMIPSFSFI